MKSLLFVIGLSVGSAGMYFYNKYAENQKLERALANADAETRQFMKCLGLNVN